MLRKLKFVFIFLVLGGISQNSFSQDVQPDPKAVEVINNFMKALSIEDFEQSVKAAMPYLHKSLLNDAGNDISPDLRRFSFKKAHDGVKFYAIPATITRVQKTTQTQVGFGPTAEAGEVYKYFVGKKEGVSGMPAPLQVFIPNGGGEPKLVNIGSL